MSVGSCRYCIYWDYMHPRWRVGVTEEVKKEVKDKIGKGEITISDYIEAECSCNPPVLLNGEFVRPFTVASDRCMYHLMNFDMVHNYRPITPDDVEK